MSEPNRFHKIERQFVTLHPIETPGWILDLGGGGEGVIGQLYGERVVAIDRMRRELEEAPGSPLKIVMDAKEMQFLDQTFATATAFFFFMFSLPQNRELIFKEVYRVLKPGGRLLIWELTIPSFPGGDEDMYVFPLTVMLPDGRTISTNYGCPWPGWEQTIEDYLRMAQEAGFSVQTYQAENSTFFVNLMK